MKYIVFILLFFSLQASAQELLLLKCSGVVEEPVDTTVVVVPCGDSSLAINYKAALVSAGFTMTDTYSKGIDTMFRRLQGCPDPRFATMNLTGKLQVIYPMFGNTEAQLKINALNPGTYGLTFPNGGIFLNGQIDFDGVDDLGETNVPNFYLTSNDVHLATYTTQNTYNPSGDGGFPNDMALINVNDPHWGYKLSNGLKNANEGAMFGYVGTDNTASVLFAPGPYSAASFANINRTSSAYTSLFRNGVKVSSSTAAPNAGSISVGENVGIMLGAHTPGAINDKSDRATTWASVGKGLTDAEAAFYFLIVEEVRKLKGVTLQH